MKNNNQDDNEENVKDYPEDTVGERKTQNGSIRLTNPLLVTASESGIPVIQHAIDGNEIRTGQVTASGKVATLATGTPAQNEEGSLEVCTEFVKRLNRDEEQWQLPDDVSASEVAGRLAGIDCVSESIEGSTQLLMQVVRAEGDSKFFQTMGREGEASSERTAEEAAAVLLEVIEKKAMKYTIKDKREIVLVLDTTDTPGYSLLPVPIFWDSHRERAATLGFKAIWIVGHAGLINRLDERE